jgi:hypothetical protein
MFERISPAAVIVAFLATSFACGGPSAGVAAAPANGNP